MGEGNGLLNSKFSEGLKDGCFLEPRFFAILRVHFLHIVQGNFNWERVDISQTHVSNTEGGRNVGSKKGSSQGHTFIRVDVQTKFLATQGCRQVGLDLRNTHSSSNKFNLIDIVQSQIGHLDCLVDRCYSTRHQVVAKFFELITIDVHGKRQVIMQRIQMNRNLLVGR
mmetsp:Transcript_8423/g.24101  ORF Transcript_8423/g.24101 Transcript_8423/m.24101 type:complete len:168 (+) Transcript_8423:1344-1847(+)